MLAPSRSLCVAWLMILFFLLGQLMLAQDSQEETKPVPFGSETELRGVIVERVQDSFLVRDYLGGKYRVAVTPSTEIKESKKNPFRKAKRYVEADLLLGLSVVVKGRGDREGALVAEEVKFTNDDLQVAKVITSTVAPVESRLDETTMSLRGTQAELEATQQRLDETTQHVEGQLEELDSAFRTARSEAGEARKIADDAQAGVVAANERIGNLDDYIVADVLKIQFAFDSAVLSEEAKAHLKELAHECALKKGYLLEVVGFSSTDGNEDYNRRLSQKRADSVVTYLTEELNTPLRRVITPAGFGEKNPVADNETMDGRKQNRRVEVRILENRGINGSTESGVGG